MQVVTGFIVGEGFRPLKVVFSSCWCYNSLKNDQATKHIFYSLEIPSGKKHKDWPQGCKMHTLVQLNNQNTEAWMVLRTVKAG